MGTEVDAILLREGGATRESKSCELGCMYVNSKMCTQNVMDERIY